MFRRIRARLTYANVVATLALFFAVGGGAAFATHLVVRSNDIVDNQVRPTDVRDDNLAGGGLGRDDILEPTLDTVPNADAVDGQSASAFVKNTVYRSESAVEAGTTLGDGTQTLSDSCDAGDRMLSGGPANIAPTTTILESFPSSTSTWTVRVNKNEQTDNYSVVVLCTNQ